MWFRFENKQVKDLILNNYEEFEPAAQEDDNNNAEHDEGIFPKGNTPQEQEQKSKFTKIEDKILVDNYEKVKDLENHELLLLDLFKGVGYFNKTASEVRNPVEEDIIELIFFLFSLFFLPYLTRSKNG